MFHKPSQRKYNRTNPHKLNQRNVLLLPHFPNYFSIFLSFTCGLCLGWYRLLVTVREVASRKAVETYFTQLLCIGNDELYFYTTLKSWL